MDPLEFWSNPDIINEPRVLFEDCGLAYLYPNFMDILQSKQLFSVLQKETKWSQDTIKMYGKEVLIPRKNSWYADAGLKYSYSHLILHPHEWYPELLEIKSKVEACAGEPFNSVLLNLYRDGNDSVAWHSDDEPELGVNPTIGSLSLGGSRMFVLRKKANRKNRFEIILNDGDLLVMSGELQHQWEHEIPKTKKNVSARINLTFRKILQS